MSETSISDSGVQADFGEVLRVHVADLRRCASVLLREFPELAASAHEFSKAAEELDAAWNRRAALPVAASDADRELMEQEIDALEDLTETIEMGDPHWADAKCFKAAVAAIAALRTRLLRHSEGKE